MTAGDKLVVFEDMCYHIHRYNKQVIKTKGHVTNGDMINLHKKALGKFTFQKPSRASNPADASAGPFVLLTIVLLTIVLFTIVLFTI